jgi:hypothetical protein
MRSGGLKATGFVQLVVCNWRDWKKAGLAIAPFEKKRVPQFPGKRQNRSKTADSAHLEGG